MTLAEALRGVARLHIDSSAFIDFAEAHPRSIAVLTRIFGRIRTKEIVAVTTTLALPEVLFHARSGIDPEEREKQYLALLDTVEIVPVTREMGLRATELRINYGLKTPDALHAASALESGCQGFLTSDSGDFLRLSGELRVIVPAKLQG